MKKKLNFKKSTKELKRNKSVKESKGTKGGRSFNIRSKIILILLVMGILPVALSGFTSYLSAKNTLSEKLEVTSAQTIQEASRGIDNYFTGKIHLMELLAMDSNIGSVENKVYFGSAQKAIGNLYDTDDNIMGVFVGTETGGFYVYPEAPDLREDFDPRTRDWYVLAMEAPGEMVYTKPYLSEAGGLVLTMAKTITKNNKVIGVLGMDIDLAAFSADLSQVKVGNQGFVFISDSTGFVVTHPDSAVIATNISGDIPEWASVITNSTGVMDYHPENGNPGFIVYFTSEITGWKIMAVLYDSELAEDTKLILATTIVMLILVAVFTVIVSFLFSAPIAKNIKALVEAFKKVANGDLTTRVKINSKDEFATLGSDFNGMVENISELMMKVNESSITVLDTSAVLASISEETSVSISEVARAIDEVAHGASEQAQNSADGATSISELADSLNLVEDATNLMSDLTNDASKLTIDGLNKMRTLIEKSNVTKDSTKKIAELIDDMNESTNKIDEISDTISKITAQTNLLALNASIEAARAGEAGRGFAVVADEIRNLAEQSKASTVEIKEIIETIKSKSILSVEAMEETENSVEEQNTVVVETQTLFNEITKAVSVLTRKVKEVSEYTQDISIKKENVIEQIENISAISEESASASEEVTASTEQITVTVDEISRYAGELQMLSEDLKQRVNSFTFE